jgi:1,4-alpha-glucan branching enzyme
VADIPVTFEYRTGLPTPFVVAARLSGSWNTLGLRAGEWSQPITMEPFTSDDGCTSFRTVVRFDDTQVGSSFEWGVSVSTSGRDGVWGIAEEVNSPDSTARVRSFTLGPNGQTERYQLTHCRNLGVNKLVREGLPVAVRFACWAPNATAVEVVIGSRGSGYIWEPGDGVVACFPMHREDGGVWRTEVSDAPALEDYGRFRHVPYMFRIIRDDFSVVYRTDLYSRCQIGSGGKNPESPRPGEPPWDGTREDLDGSKSCSVVIDPDQVCELFEEGTWPETRWLPAEDFWRDEYRANRPVPDRLKDLVIYELHVDSLGLGHVPVGTMQDAMDFITYLCDLGVNAVELMPMSEFQDRAGWGYSTSHYFAIEFTGGGRDKFKHFVRECHRHGIAVILDVVYNHYTFDAERAEWAYDSARPERNQYYWYEGSADQYADPDGGYVDNGSSGWAPRFSSPMVRRMFTSSAAALLAEYHFDGFRVDLTQAIHRDNVRHADGSPVPEANLFGQKLLREWSNTLKLIRPDVFLIAEDHTGWPAVYSPTDAGGLGFDATWYADFHHHVIGGTSTDQGHAQLVRLAGYGDDRPLHMGWLAGALSVSADSRVVYHASHDEVGNAQDSARGVVLAVNGAPLVGQTRRFAEARARFAAGMTLTAPGVPMFFMGEEVGVSTPYRYDDFRSGRESRDDLIGLRAGYGASLFAFYADLIRFRLAHPALRSRNCEVVHVNDDDRVLAFRRWEGSEELLVVGTLSNRAFGNGYRISLPDPADPDPADGLWREILTSDAAEYGGSDLRNDALILSSGGVITVNLPANTVLVLERQRDGQDVTEG